MLMEVSLRADELELRGYHVEEKTVRERFPSDHTIDEWKHVVIGLHVFLPDFSECSE
jgi:hypothetical protein